MAHGMPGARRKPLVRFDAPPDAASHAEKTCAAQSAASMHVSCTHPPAHDGRTARSFDPPNVVSIWEVESKNIPAWVQPGLLYSSPGCVTDTKTLSCTAASVAPLQGRYWMPRSPMASAP